jgi:hypothetical protein
MTENCDIFLIYLISIKLDPVTRRDWEKETKIDELPTLKELTGFLEIKCRILATIERQSKFTISTLQPTR